MKTRMALALAVAAWLAAASPANAASTPIGEPAYAWHLREVRESFVAPGDIRFHDVLAASGAQTGGTLVKTHTLGSSMLGLVALDSVAGYDDGHDRNRRGTDWRRHWLCHFGLRLHIGHGYSVVADPVVTRVHRGGPIHQPHLYAGADWLGYRHPLGVRNAHA